MTVNRLRILTCLLLAGAAVSVYVRAAEYNEADAESVYDCDGQESVLSDGTVRTARSAYLRATLFDIHQNRCQKLLEPLNVFENGFILAPAHPYTGSKTTMRLDANTIYDRLTDDDPAVAEAIGELFATVQQIHIYDLAPSFLPSVQTLLTRILQHPKSSGNGLSVALWGSVASLRTVQELFTALGTMPNRDRITGLDMALRVKDTNRIHAEVICHALAQLPAPETLSLRFMDLDDDDANAIVNTLSDRQLRLTNLILPFNRLSDRIFDKGGALYLLFNDEGKETSSLFLPPHAICAKLKT